MEIIRHHQHGFRLSKQLRLFYLQCHQLIDGVKHLLLDTCSGIQFILGNDFINFLIHALCSAVTICHSVADTLAFLINALLGVGEMDLYLDYELSFFSEAGCRDGAKPENMMNTFRNLVNYLKNYGAGTLQQNTRRFLRDLGVTQEEMDTICNVMLEEIKA